MTWGKTVSSKKNHHLKLWSCERVYVVLSQPVKEIGNLFEYFPKPLEIFAHLLKALIKPLKCYEKPITSHLSAVSFCLFNGKALVYIFLKKVTFFFKNVRCYCSKKSCNAWVLAYSQVFSIHFRSWSCWFYLFKV